MIVEQMGYAIRCDYPGCETNTRDLGDYAFWGDLGSAVDEWHDHEGIYTEDGRAFCDWHTVWNTDEDGEEARLPMEHTLANDFALANRRISIRIQNATNRALQANSHRWHDMQRSVERRARGADEMVKANLVWLNIHKVARGMDLPCELLHECTPIHTNGSTT